jgi:hypothetical protein
MSAREARMINHLTSVHTSSHWVVGIERPPQRLAEAHYVRFSLTLRMTNNESGLPGDWSLFFGASPVLGAWDLELRKHFLAFARDDRERNRK